MDLIEEKGVLLQTDREVYGPSDKVVVTITNITRNSIFVHTCNTVLEERQSRGWIYVEGVICVAIPLAPTEIKPGESREFPQFWFHENQGEGDYRIVFDIRDESGEPLPEESRVTQTIAYNIAEVLPALE